MAKGLAAATLETETEEKPARSLAVRDVARAILLGIKMRLDPGK